MEEVCIQAYPGDLSVARYRQVNHTPSPRYLNLFVVSVIYAAGSMDRLRQRGFTLSPMVIEADPDHDTRIFDATISHSMPTETGQCIHIRLKSVAGHWESFPDDEPQNFLQLRHFFEDRLSAASPEAPPRSGSSSAEESEDVRVPTRVRGPLSNPQEVDMWRVPGPLSPAGWERSTRDSSHRQKGLFFRCHDRNSVFYYAEALLRAGPPAADPPDFKVRFLRISGQPLDPSYAESDLKRLVHETFEIGRRPIVISLVVELSEVVDLFSPGRPVYGGAEKDKEDGEDEEDEEDEEDKKQNGNWNVIGNIFTTV
ncbi:hypothetical protein BV20DRAFT_816677 [Pilatotrama ljubarskyi]|nr:hypothetical protein BV20DRAFT_816677 [Pilatotrama ljubarskyi]